jgi:hypothetical protein
VLQSWLFIFQYRLFWLHCIPPFYTDSVVEFSPQHSTLNLSVNFLFLIECLCLHAFTQVKTFADGLFCSIPHSFYTQHTASHSTHTLDTGQDLNMFFHSFPSILHRVWFHSTPSILHRIPLTGMHSHRSRLIRLFCLTWAAFPAFCTDSVVEMPF